MNQAKSIMSEIRNAWVYFPLCHLMTRTGGCAPPASVACFAGPSGCSSADRCGAQGPGRHLCVSPSSSTAPGTYPHPPPATRAGEDVQNKIPWRSSGPGERQKSQQLQIRLRSPRHAARQSQAQCEGGSPRGKAVEEGFTDTEKYEPD